VRLAALPKSIDHEMLGHSRSRKETRQALEETAVSVLEVEAVWITEDTHVSSLEALLDAAADLEARFIDVVCFDPDVNRASETFAELGQVAASFCLRCSIEFLGFSAVPTIDAALRMVDRVATPGAGVLIDPLAVFRTGASIADISLIAPSA
jgi:sugar phosphate isomerase/epimerase